MLHVGSDGYWRDTWGKGPGKTTKTFGHKSKVSKTKAMIAWREWRDQLAAGVQVKRALRSDSPSLASVVQQFLAWAETYYRRKDGTPTREDENLLCGLQPLVDLFGTMPIDQFGTEHMEAFCDAQAKHVGPQHRTVSRQTINKRLGYIRRLFKWTKNQGISPQVYDRIRDFPGLRAGRSEAREAEPVIPVPLHVVEDTMKFLTDDVKAMVQLQLLTAIRPGEACSMTAAAIDRSREPWLYQPPYHKNEWRGKDRRIFFGPKARKLLKPFLEKRPFTGPVFLSADGTAFNPQSYRQAIWRACDRAFPSSEPRLENENVRAFRKRTNKWRIAQRWSPNQLRHNRLTEVERLHGMETSRALGGHTTADTTAIYVERDDRIVKDLMEKIG